MLCERGDYSDHGGVILPHILVVVCCSVCDAVHLISSTIVQAQPVQFQFPNIH